jgi:MFS family permease
MAVASNIAGFITDKWGTNRTAVLGASVALAGAVSLAVDPALGGAAGLGVRLAVTGLGMGTFHVPAQTLFMTQAPGELRGTAGATVNMLRQLGFSMGPALATIVWFTAGKGTSSGLGAAYLVPAVAAVAALVATTWWMAARPTVMRAAPAPAPADTH